MIVTYAAVHAEDFKHYTTEKIRSRFLIDELFRKDEIIHAYTHYDRLVVSGAKPETKPLVLEPFDELKSSFFLERRELGIINVGSPAQVTVDDKEYTLGTKEALYVGRGSRKVIFHPGKKGAPVFYMNSAPAHHAYPTRLVTQQDAEKVELGSTETANHRMINKLIVTSILPTCQLQMGLTELRPGSVWNTMPPHTHTRRMEAYFYFDLPENQRVCHFLGEPDETRHIWVSNHQVVLSAPWSVHCGAGTSNYSFIWGMAGENLDYSDMDAVKLADLK